jgi:hypothetical protein
MVNGKSIAVVALAVCAVAVGVGIYTLPSDDVSYPGAMSAELQDFRVGLSYHSDKIYEGTEFKVEVYNADTEEIVEGANISFMIPLIRANTNKEGFVLFYAPRIQDAYLLHPTDTSRSFPLTVEKDGYNTYVKDVVVHVHQ